MSDEWISGGRACEHPGRSIHTNNSMINLVEGVVHFQHRGLIQTTVRICAGQRVDLRVKLQAKIVLNTGIKNDLNRKIILVAGSDCYQQAFSMGELVPAIGGNIKSSSPMQRTVCRCHQTYLHVLLIPVTSRKRATFRILFEFR